MSGTLRLGNAVLAAFQRVHETAFAGDPACNPALSVAVTGVLMAMDTPTLVLLTPWTLNGLAFPPDAGLPASCAVLGVTRPLHRSTLAGLGEYCSFNLVPDVAKFPAQERALAVANNLALSWRDVIAHLRDAATVADPARRRLLNPRAWGQ